MTWKWEYYLKDRGPFQTVQEAMDALGLDKETRPQHNRWSRLSTQLKDTIQRRPKAVGTVSLKAKFRPRDKVRFSNRGTKYITADLRKRTRTIVDMFYDPVNHCCFYELGARGNGTLGYFFRSYMLLHANGNQHTVGRPRQKRRYNRRTKFLFKPPNQNLGANHREAYFPFTAVVYKDYEEMSKKIRVARPGVVLRKRTARTPKRCTACGCPILPGESYWDRKVSWQRFSVPVCEKCG